MNSFPKIEILMFFVKNKKNVVWMKKFYGKYVHFDVWYTFSTMLTRFWLEWCWPIFKWVIWMFQLNTVSVCEGRNFYPKIWILSSTLNLIFFKRKLVTRAGVVCAGLICFVKWSLCISRAFKRFFMVAQNTPDHIESQKARHGKAEISIRKSGCWAQLWICCFSKDSSSQGRA